MEKLWSKRPIRVALISAAISSGVCTIAASADITFVGKRPITMPADAIEWPDKNNRTFLVPYEEANEHFCGGLDYLIRPDDTFNDEVITAIGHNVTEVFITCQTGDPNFPVEFIHKPTGQPV